MIYVHYGFPRFVPQLFQPIRNVKGRTKPSGGLWATRKTNYGWVLFCADRNYPPERTATSFSFTLRPGANVLHLSAPEDLEGLPRFNTRQPRILRGCPWPPLDFEELQRRGVDAIEVEIKDLYHHMPTWDCDSLLVLNPDVIVLCTE